MRSQLGKATALAIMGEGCWVRAGMGWGALGEARLGWPGGGALPGVSSPPASPGDKLWWADQVSEKMGTCNKADGSESVVLRNSTTLVMHMKVYDESIQLGEAGGHGQGRGWGGWRGVAASTIPGQGGEWEGTWVRDSTQPPPGEAPLSHCHKGTVRAYSHPVTRAKGPSRTKDLGVGWVVTPHKVQGEGGDHPIPKRCMPDSEVPRRATSVLSLSPYPHPRARRHQPLQCQQR